MAIPVALLAASAAAPAIGGLVGNMLSSGDRAKAQEQLQAIYNQYANLNIPDTEKMRLALEEYQNVGNLQAQTDVAEQLANTDAMENISLDPRLRQAQMDQLQSLAKLGETSFTPEEQAQLNKMRRQVEADATARTKAMLEEQDRRGVGSSEAGLAARMLGAQSSANRQAEQADELAAMAFKRALEAKAGAASLGGQIEDRDYSQQKSLADALNAREAANVQLRTSANQRNTDRQQAVNQFNLQNQQNISNANTDTRNKEQTYNKGLEQQNFDNQLKKLAGMSGAQTGLANQYQNNADRTAQMWAGIGAGAGQGIATYGMNSASAAKATPEDTTTNTDMTPDALEAYLTKKRTS